MTHQREKQTRRSGLRRFGPGIALTCGLTGLLLMLVAVYAPALAAGDQAVPGIAAGAFIDASTPFTKTETLGVVYLPLLVHRAQDELAADATPTSPTATPPPEPPFTATATPDVAVHPEPRREWDPRLWARGVVLREAEVAEGQGYWRLVRAVWYDEEESQGRHHIFMDALDQDGKRIVGLPIRVYWEGGSATVTVQAKPGEAYGADFGMFAVAPAYGAVPGDANPGDDVWGMGLGSLEQPSYAIHTSYGLVWQWTVKRSGGEEATATPTPTPLPTQPSVTPTPTVATPTPASDSAYLFGRAELVRCAPNGGITYVEGTVRLDGQPADGFRVVFSYAPDGPIVSGILSGPHAGYPGWNPGFYSHILQAGGPRQGDWWFWIVDAENVRISEMAYVHTDAFVNAHSCQQAVIDFDSR